MTVRVGFPAQALQTWTTVVKLGGMTGGVYSALPPEHVSVIVKVCVLVPLGQGVSVGQT